LSGKEEGYFVGIHGRGISNDPAGRRKL